MKKAEMMRKQVEEELREDGGMTERQRELQLILNQLAPLELTLYEIQADGHCLYRAISHQMQFHNNEWNEFDYMKLRQLAAKYMREHKEDFIYFIDTENGDVMDDARYEEYCKKVENSSEWGGQVELRAIANALQRPIRIFQNGQLIVMGEEFSKEDNMLSISYHRNYYSLGEHYNSVIKKQQLEEQF
jgi:OTU domain-containing protein 6